MCACDWNFVCDLCQGTPADPRYYEMAQPREDDLERYQQSMSTPDFLTPFKEAA